MRPAELHQSRELLVAFALGQVDESFAQTIALHLETCAECRRIAIDAPSDDFVNRVREAHASLFSHDATLLHEHPAQEDYEVLHEIGRGGMGVVYLVRNRRMDRLEALKVMKQSLLGRLAARERFQQEIRSAARLHHPHIVTAYNAPIWDGSLALAMEYVQGENLHQIVQSRGTLTLQDACRCAYQAALGLQHAHESKMVHRDLKPNNLMLAVVGAQPSVKILDFGLSKVGSEIQPDGGLTNAGQMLGSLHFMAPEQAIDSASADIRADIYSLGCTLYYLLAGRPPFEARSEYELLKAHDQQAPPAIDAARPDAPAALAAVVSKMMAKNPAARYQSPGEAALALEPFLNSASTATAAQRSFTPRRLAIALGLILMAGALLGLSLSLNTPEGVVELHVNVDRPEVSIDGAHATVKWENGGKRAEIYLAPGTHQIELRKGELKAYGKKVVLEEGGHEVIAATLTPLKPDRTASAKPGLARGAWKVVGDEIHQESKTPALFLFGSRDYGDIDFDCELWRGTEDVGICLAFRAADLRNYYYFEIGGYRNTLFDLEAVGPGGYRRLAVRRGSAATDRWSRVKIRLRGDSIEGYVDDELVVDAKDGWRSKGYVGLRTWAGAARFRKIRITDPEGSLLWDALPNVPDVDVSGNDELNQPFR